ncbi:MAG: hypothetical protein AAGC57_06205 [Pseudomonadota bacterium]
MSEGYCCFTVKSTREKICSAKKFKNHKLAAAWVKTALEGKGLPANDIAGKPRYPLTKTESGAASI